MHQASDKFYRSNSQRYAEVFNESLQIPYDNVSHPKPMDHCVLFARKLK